jgi:hypothetical protein
MSEQAQQDEISPPIKHNSPQNFEKDLTTTNGEPLSRTPSEPPWSIFSKKETVLIVILASLAAFLSPLTASI